MIFALLILAQQPGAPPTVGDTVWIIRTLAVPAGMTVRPRPISASAVAEPLGPPEVVRIEDSVRVRYPMVAWQPGRHAITVPGAILVRSDGWSDTLPDGRATIEVATVLPETARDSLSPFPQKPPVERTRRSPLPVLLLTLLAGAILVPLHWWWGRRGPPVSVARAPVTPGPSEVMLASWLAAGEYRAAVEGWFHRLGALGGRDAEGDALLARLGQARFAPLPEESMAELCREVASWSERRAG